MIVIGNISREEIASFMDDALFADGFDEAIIGYVQRCGMSVVLYDARKYIEILITDEGLTEEEAVEHFDCNILGTWVGDNTPAFAFLEDYL